MTNKILLAVIGAGLWANAAATYVRPASAQSEGFGLIIAALGDIKLAIDRVAMRDCK